MKRRVNFVVMMVLVVLAALVWAVAKNQRNAIKTAAASTPAALNQTPAPALPVVVLPLPQPAKAAVLVAPQQVTEPVDHITASGAVKHVAQSGETVTSLATDYLGKDTTANRDAIINANSSLKADPDKLIAGKSYRIPSATETPAAVDAPVIHPAANAVPKPQVNDVVAAEPAKELKYTAAPGDTVSNMAGAFLGSDDKTQQDKIVKANASLQADPDRVVAGKSYRIPAPDGLSAAATSSASARANTLPAATTQPDADQVVVAGSPRTLQYVARPGDTVTDLAIELLGSDTQETRDAIINNNPVLKHNPDLVVAGQTYWIPAPVPANQKP
jgi:hypothetical protein